MESNLVYALNSESTSCALAPHRITLNTVTVLQRSDTLKKMHSSGCKHFVPWICFRYDRLTRSVANAEALAIVKYAFHTAILADL